MEAVAPGVWRFRLGTPESITPVTVRDTSPRVDAFGELPDAGACPVDEAKISSRLHARGFVVEIPVADTEQFYGLGLQLKSFNQTGLKKTLRVNSDPVADTGDSHAPVPFFVSTAGYSIFVDSARYATFYFATHSKRGSSKPVDGRSSIETDIVELYRANAGSNRSVLIEIPSARGVDLYVFSGPTSRQAVQRYNLYSGGGCLPPLWGLGIWYRPHGQANAAEIESLARSFRDRRIPCDVIGVEPGWQTKVYSCSLVWSPERFPDPQRFVKEMNASGFQINLWEHVFLDPTCPLYASLFPFSGSEEVWNGLVPDLLTAEGRAIFGDYHRIQFVKKGISGFKLDECDSSDFIRSPWSFPETSSFPSGTDGEQMHCLLGTLYQRTILDGFNQSGIRTFGSVRNAGGLAAPYPFVLYSDLYDHRDFIRGVVNSGFTGILWTPEVRDAVSAEDLLRRIQSVILAPQALINGWYIKHPPWLQFETKLNNEGRFLDDADQLEEAIRRLFQLRMSLVPYLYAAFAKYYFQGLPPFRALVLDYPTDPATYKVDDQFLVGDDLLVAPCFVGQLQREVYLPEGDWYDFHSHQKYRGRQTHSIKASVENIPIFVKSGAILPLAAPVDYVGAQTIFDLVLSAFGAAEELRPATLFEDDGLTVAFKSGEYNWVTFRPDRSVDRVGNFPGRRYEILDWKTIP